MSGLWCGTHTTFCSTTSPTLNQSRVLGCAAYDEPKYQRSRAGGEWAPRSAEEVYNSFLRKEPLQHQPWGRSVTLLLSTILIDGAMVGRKQDGRRSNWICYSRHHRLRPLGWVLQIRGRQPLWIIAMTCTRGLWSKESSK